jgi:proton-coupled amino acid transporter
MDSNKLLRRTYSFPGPSQRNLAQLLTSVSHGVVIPDDDSIYGSDEESELVDDVRVSETGLRRAFRPIRTNLPQDIGPTSAPAELAVETTSLLGNHMHSGVQSSNQIHSGTSITDTFFVLTKAFLGTGILVLPKAVSNGGLVFSIMGLVFGGLLSWHCMTMLVAASLHIVTPLEQQPGYGDVGEALFGQFVRILILSSVAVSQLGFGVANLIFVAVNLRDALDYFSLGKFNPSFEEMLVPLCLFLIPMVWIRHLRHFSLPALLADVFILVGIAFVSIVSFNIITKEPAWKHSEFSWLIGSKPGTFFGSAIYAYEGIAFTLPIYQSMANPKKFNLVLGLTIMTVGVLMLIVGILGYLAFGNQVSTIIFQDMPTENIFARIVQTLYALGIYSCLALTLFIPVRLIESWIFSTHARAGRLNYRIKWLKNLFRAALVVFLSYVAIRGSHHLDAFISLIGSLTCIPLSFVFPALFSLRIQAAQGWSSKWWVKDFAILLFGVAATLYITMQNIMLISSHQ